MESELEGEVRPKKRVRSPEQKRQDKRHEEERCELMPERERAHYQVSEQGYCAARSSCEGSVGRYRAQSQEEAEANETLLARLRAALFSRQRRVDN